MISTLTGILLFQVALVAPPGATPDAALGDIVPAEIGQWKAGKAIEKFSAVQANQFAAGDDAVALAELGFLGAQRREYVASGNRHMTVEAIRMKDATAAYGAFAWYRQQGWREEANGTADPRPFHAAVGPNDAVLQRNGFCIRVLGTPSTHDLLAGLAKALPSLENEPLPTLPSYLPAHGMVKSSAKYASGPQVFQKLVPQVPPMAVGFHMGAEVVSAEYRLPGKSPMNLVLATYPTPQIARKFAENIANANGNVQVQRKGTMVLMVPDAQKADADSLMNMVHYEFAGTWNEKVPKNIVPSVASMILSIMELCGILLVFCLLSGAVYGGIRILIRRKYSDQILDSEIEVIQLHLNS